MSFDEEIATSSEAPDFQKTPEDVGYEGQVIENDEEQVGYAELRMVSF